MLGECFSIAGKPINCRRFAGAKKGQTYEDYRVCVFSQLIPAPTPECFSRQPRLGSSWRSTEQDSDRHLRYGRGTQARWLGLRQAIARSCVERSDLPNTPPTRVAPTDRRYQTGVYEPIAHSMSKFSRSAKVEIQHARGVGKKGHSVSLDPLMTKVLEVEDIKTLDRILGWYDFRPLSEAEIKANVAPGIQRKVQLPSPPLTVMATDRPELRRFDRLVLENLDKCLILKVVRGSVLTPITRSDAIGA